MQCFIYNPMLRGLSGWLHHVRVRTISSGEPVSRIYGRHAENKFMQQRKRVRAQFVKYEFWYEKTGCYIVCSFWTRKHNTLEGVVGASSFA